MEKLELKVKGMSCSGCERRIQDVIKEMSGVKEVVADYRKDLVTITLTKYVDEEVFIEKIEELGYEVKK